MHRGANENVVCVFNETNRMEDIILIINCTKKLIDTLKIKPEVAEHSNSIFSWHANIININRRKTIVLTNDANRYIVVMHGLKSKDFSNIGDIIKTSIQETLMAEGIKHQIIEKYMSDSCQIQFSKTQSRSLVARMNKGCECADIFDTEYDTSTITQFQVTKKASGFTFIEVEQGHYHPNKVLYNNLEKLYGAPIFSIKALTLKIKLRLEKFDVWRRITVPLDINFEDLHKIIEIAFDWKGYHLHDFMISENGKPILNILCCDEDMSYPSKIPTVMESDTKIQEYLPKHKQIVYTYDFGDNWEHIIEVEDLLFDFDKNHPVCIDGSGDRPPEDVGGEGGYEDFIETMKDPSHEDYIHLKEWSESQYYGGFKINIVNNRLKYI